MLGYVFNPASFYLCRDRFGDLRVVIVEVHNTFGERHLYTLRARDRGIARPLADAMDKAFFVSPFIAATAGTRSTSATSPTGCAWRSPCARTASRC